MTLVPAFSALAWRRGSLAGFATKTLLLIVLCDRDRLIIILSAPQIQASRGVDLGRAGMIETLHSPFSNSTEAGGMMYSFASQQDAAADAAR